MEKVEAGLPAPYPLPNCDKCGKYHWGGATVDTLPTLGYSRYTWKCPCGNKMVWCPPEATTGNRAGPPP